MDFDLELTRRADGTTTGYMLDWDADDPMRVISSPPEVPISTSTGVAESGGSYSGKDAAPPYPIEVNNWQDGAGQPSYDKKDASPDAYAASKNIDVSDEGHFELGPRPFAYALTAPAEIGNRAIHALGTFWSSFTPAGSDPRLSVRYLTRFPVVAGSDDYLGTTTSTTLGAVDVTALSDISGGVSAQDLAAYDYLYCPTHNEIVAVSTIVGTDVTVVRGFCGTAAAEHTAGETWYAFGFRAVAFGAELDADPDDPVTAFATDGASLYASFWDGSTASGEIWSGNQTDAWAKFGDIQQVREMALCAGFLYCAQDNVSGSSQVSAVEDDGMTTHIVSADGGIMPNVTTAGLATLGNYVYWAVTDGYSRSWVYKLQYSATATTFELVAELPNGFVATSLVSALSNIYVGGYMDTLVTDADNAGDHRYQGYLYAIISDSQVNVACKFTDSSNDYRITGLVAGGPYIYMLTPNDVRCYSLEHGGWWHVADVLTSTADYTTPAVDWTTAGFDFNPVLYGSTPAEAQSIRTDYASWEDGTSGWMATANVVADHSTSSDLTGLALVDYGYEMGVAAGKYYRYTIDGLPATNSGTMEVVVSNPLSQGGSFCMAGSTKEVRVYLTGSGLGDSSLMRVGLRYSSNGGTSYAGTYWSDYVPGGTGVTVRATLNPSTGAKVYINDSLALSAPLNELLTVSGTGASKVWFACGWPGDAQTDTKRESIWYERVRFTSSGGYDPDYTPTTVAIDTDCIAFGEGRLLVPAPATCATYIDPKENFGGGWLQTSDSGLHMGTVDKYFTAVDVIHTPLRSGQSITVSPYIDGVSGGSATFSGPSSDVGATTSSAPIARAGKRMSVVVALRDTMNNRRRDDSLKVTSITGRFFTANSSRLHVFVLKCKKTQTRTGGPWVSDDAAIRTAFDIADSGEVVDVKCLWGEFAGRVEDLALSGVPAERATRDKLAGTLTMKVRSYG